MASRIQGITVEIGGDTTKLTNALKGVNGEIRNTQTQLKDVEKLLKLDPSNTELLSQKQRLLTQEVQATKEKLEALKTASEQANTALENGTITREQYDALQREIIETEQALEDLETQAGESSVALQKIANAGSSMQTLGNNVTNVGKKMSVFSAGIVATGTASANMAMNFEDAMAKVSTIADTTEVPLEELEQAILDLSNQTGISSTEIAENVYNAISAGQSTGDAVNFVTNSTKLAKAGFAEAGASLDLLTTILNAYGLEASEVTAVSDMLIQTQNLGKTTVGELSSAMGKVIPTANAYGVELDQLCAGYAIMTANGVATAESTTYMNSMLNELGKSGTNVSNILKEKTGSSFAELMEQGYSLSEVLAIIEGAAEEQGLAFGDMWSSSEAAKAGLILLGDSAENFNGTLEQMRNSTGATDTAFEKLQTNSYTIQVAINQLKNTAIELGTAIMSVLAPIITSLAEKISALTKWFSGLSDTSKKVIVIVGMIVAAIGPVLVVVGKVISAVGTIMTILPKLGPVITTVKTAFATLNTTMLANPIVLIIAAIAALVAAFIYLWNNCDGFRQFWIDLWENVKQVAIAVWNAIKNFFSAVWEAIKTIFTTVFEIIKTLVTTYFNFYKTIIETVFGVIKTVVTTAWNAIKGVFETVFNVIKTIVTTQFNIYKTIIETVLNVIKTVVTNVWNTIKTVVTTVMNAIKTVFTTVWNAIKTIISAVVSGIKGLITGDFTAVKNAISTIMNTIKSTISTIWNTIKNTISTVLNAIKNGVSNIFNGILNSIKNAMTKVFTAVKDGFSKVKSHITGLASQALTWGKDLVMGLVNGIKSCIGAVGDAVKSVADKIKSFLHFSVPDEGPLTEYEEWMPDFMQGLAKGIERSKGLVTDAVKGLASDMVVNPNVTASMNGIAEAPTTSTGSSIAGFATAITDAIRDISGQSGDIVIPVYLGGTMLDEVIVSAQQRANLRSGGR